MILRTILKVALFFALVPGILVKIPSNGSTIQQAAVHAIVFAVANYLMCKYLFPMIEGFDNPSTKVDPPCPEGYKRCPSGDCVLAADVHGACPA
jgi:hypothetical protein